MAKSLVIVESPAKVKTINKFLGNKFKVTSSMGHLIDLPKSSLGVDIDNNFEPKMIAVRAKQKILTKLKKEAEKKEAIYIATDPDREGEAIGWNLVDHIAKDKEVYRVVFNEITKEAVLKAFDDKHSFDQNKVSAQNARRVLDRIVGYQISPLLWKKVGSRLSAGRVQSVALRLIVERERAIKSFIPKEYWEIEIDLKKEDHDGVLTAQLEKIRGKKAILNDGIQSGEVVEKLKELPFVISNINERTIRRNAQPPFITSTMQQDAFSKLGFNAQRTMMTAQQLYEGIEIGQDDAVGLITYMRTDSVHIANEAIDRVRQYINDEYGEKYLPKSPNKFKSKKSAQEAHEAIRPTDVRRTPEKMKNFLTEDQFKLYSLIWKRFVSCQMTKAVYESKKIEITADIYQFGASGSTLKFDGYLKLYRNDDEEEDKKLDVSHFKKDNQLQLTEARPSQHFTKPPARYSEASLVKALEEDGIGRPSTYASIIQTLVNRNYVQRERGYFIASELGMIVCDLLVENFPGIMDVKFTAEMEAELDKIEEGTQEYAKLLQEFYKPFKKELEKAMDNVEKKEMTINRKCPDCGSDSLVIKWGRNGRFLSCPNFPDCKHAEPYPIGLRCPEEDCQGELVERRSRRGSTFFGCSSYPECKFIVNRKADIPNIEDLVIPTDRQ